MAKNLITQTISTAAKYIIGKEREVKLFMTSVLANGHLLIEDVPGVGKTTMVLLITRLFGLKLSRIQFTNDLMPYDILGMNFFNQQKSAFEFRKGPLFGEFILADELNRAGPKTQSALLQAMEERSITIDGEHFDLDWPFIVVATQNPYDQLGTHFLPESQLDRFFMSFCLGLPEREEEKKVLLLSDVRKKIEGLVPIWQRKDLKIAQEKVLQIYVSNQIVEYTLDILESCRNFFETGHTISTRSGRDIILGAKAYAFMEGREFVTPDDIQAIVPYCLAHRTGKHRKVEEGIKIVRGRLEKINVNPSLAKSI